MYEVILLIPDTKVLLHSILLKQTFYINNT